MTLAYLRGRPPAGQPLEHTTNLMNESLSEFVRHRTLLAVNIWHVWRAALPRVYYSKSSIKCNKANQHLESCSFAGKTSWADDGMGVDKSASAGGRKGDSRVNGLLPTADVAKHKRPTQFLTKKKNSATLNLRVLWSINEGLLYNETKVKIFYEDGGKQSNLQQCSPKYVLITLS